MESISLNNADAFIGVLDQIAVLLLGTAQGFFGLTTLGDLLLSLAVQAGVGNREAGRGPDSFDQDQVISLELVAGLSDDFQYADHLFLGAQRHDQERGGV